MSGIEITISKFDQIWRKMMSLKNDKNKLGRDKGVGDYHPIFDEFVGIGIIFKFLNMIMSFILDKILKDKEKWYLFPILTGFIFTYFNENIDKNNYFIILLGSLVFSILSLFIYYSIGMAFVAGDFIGESLVRKLIENPDPRNIFHRLIHLFLSIIFFLISAYIIIYSFTSDECAAFYRGSCI